MQLPAPPGLRGAPLSQEEGVGTGFYLAHLPITWDGQVGTVLCAYLPLPSGLHRSLDFFFPCSFSLHPRKIDSEPGVVLLRSKRGVIARALSRGVRLQSVQSLSHIRLFVTPWTAARQVSLFITSSRRLLKLMSIQSVKSSNCPGSL